MSKRPTHRHPPRQSGVVLITGLIFMVMLTLIVLAALRTGLLEERMAANARNRQLALQAAEAVLRDAEVSLFGAPTAPIIPFTPSGFTADCTNGLCTKPVTTDEKKRWKTIDWTSTTKTRTFAPCGDGCDPKLTSALVAGQPRYIVEVFSSAGVISPAAGGGICQGKLYRVTARGLGRDASEVFVQTMYQMPPTNPPC